MNFLKFALDRLDEPSTWRGLVAIATALGVQLSPDLQAAIISAGMAVIGLIAVLTADKK